jgi:CRISPR/Cas system-associated endonuclease Cas1
MERPALVFDLMEPLRPVVKVLEFVRSHTFHPADFTIRPDGVPSKSGNGGACGKVGHRGAKGKSSQIKFLPNARFSLKVRAWLGGKEGS